MQNYIRTEKLREFPLREFRRKKPYPWHPFEGFLTPEAFKELHRYFPPPELFEHHYNLERGYGQRPHNRYYLAYETSVYHDPGYRGPGLVQPEDLPECWRRFIAELQGGSYRGFLRKVLKSGALTLRFAWHMTGTGCEVSPHFDKTEKAGIHNLFFNTREDWDPAWGGEALVLGALKRPVKNPDFDDFAGIDPVPICGNRSLFFHNKARSWHGMRPLTCPAGQYRRLFSVLALRREPLLKRGARRLLMRLRGDRPYAGDSR